MGAKLTGDSFTLINPNFVKCSSSWFSFQFVFDWSFQTVVHVVCLIGSQPSRSIWERICLMTNDFFRFSITQHPRLYLSPSASLNNRNWRKKFIIGRSPRMAAFEAVYVVLIWFGWPYTHTTESPPLSLFIDSASGKPGVSKNLFDDVVISTKKTVSHCATKNRMLGRSKRL